MDKRDFLNIMATAQVAFGTEIDEKRTDLYWQALQYSDASLVGHRLDDHIKTEKFFPKIAELRPLPDRRPQLGPKYIEQQPFSLVMAQANRIMFALLMQTGGVKKETLELLILAKNAMVTDAENTDQNEVEFAAALDKQLRELITGHEERRT